MVYIFLGMETMINLAFSLFDEVNLFICSFIEELVRSTRGRKNRMGMWRPIVRCIVVSRDVCVSFDKILDYVNN